MLKTLWKLCLIMINKIMQNIKMKKLLIIFLLVLTSNTVFAQNIDTLLSESGKFIDNINNTEIKNIDDVFSLVYDSIEFAYVNNTYSIKKYPFKKIYSDKELADIGFKYAKNNKNRLACSDKFINGNMKSKLFFQDINKYLRLDRQLEKSVKILENYIKENTDEAGETLFFISYLYFLKDMFYNYDKISYYCNQFLSVNGAIAVEGIREDLEFLAEMIADVTKMKFDNVVDFYNYAVENGYIDDVIMTSGYADIYNDGFYHKFIILKNNTHSILVIDEEKLSDNNENLYTNLYYKLFGDNNSGDPKKYEPEHCTSYVYQGNLYVLPFNKKYYLVNTSEVDNSIKTISIKNPAYFNVNYGENYNITEIFKDDKKAKALHGVSQMGKFSYKDNIIYEVKYDKEPQSPAGDIDTLDNMYDYSKPLTYGQILYYAGDRNYEKAIKSGKYNQNDVKEYMEYLSSYSKYPITTYDYDLLFYDIGKKDPVYIACIIDKQTKNIVQYFVVEDSLDILSIDLTRAVSDFTDSYLWNINVKITYKDNNPQLIYVRQDGQVLIVNIKDGRAKFDTFQAYNVKNKQEINNLDKEKTLFNLHAAANIDCSKTSANKALQLICSSRELLSHKAYIEVLYKEKQKKAEKKLFAEKAKQKNITSYDNMNNEVLSCSNKECISDLFFKYQELFLK